MFGGDAEEDFGGAGRFAAALFPVLQGVLADAEEFGEFGLGQAELEAHADDIVRRLDREGARGFGVAAWMGRDSASRSGWKWGTAAINVF